MVFIGSGLLVGGLLGARLTVLALVPAMAIVFCLAAVVWVGEADVPQWGCLQILLVVVFLQVGYLCGAALRLFVAPVRVTRGLKALRSHW
jgi:hypothetical protein